MGQKENQFSEGVALGLAMLGQWELPNDKPMIELAFSRAWKSWQYAREFPFVGSTSRQDEIYQMTHAGKNHRTVYFYWDVRQVIERWDGLPDAQTIAKGIHDGIPAEAWRALMEATLRLYKNPRATTDGGSVGPREMD